LQMESSLHIKATLIKVAGAVQGVGFRPFCYRTALRLGLNGYVLNNLGGVEIVLEGKPASITSFIAELKSSPPPASRITSIDTHAVEFQGFNDFKIIASKAGQASQELQVSADLATCEACKKEILNTADRRAAYPFTNCTDCGPRYTIIENLPYDRPKTVMDEFQMCPDCQGEYNNPMDRRFHAQPNACPVCGPAMVLLNNKGRTLDCKNPIAKAAELIMRGKIVAVKGLGGYHLMCNALDPKAISLLRKRKRRPHKPLAVMCADITMAASLADISDAEGRVLESSAAPILLLKWRQGVADDIRCALAPLNSGIGIMLAYTPVHHLLFAVEEAGKKLGPIVATSANVSNQPIIADEVELIKELGSVFDAVLAGNRRIANRIDDSLGYLREPWPQQLSTGAELGAENSDFSKNSSSGTRIEGMSKDGGLFKHLSLDKGNAGERDKAFAEDSSPADAGLRLDADRTKGLYSRPEDALADSTGKTDIAAADSDFSRGKLVLIRRARGYAPAPLKTAFNFPPMLAVGAEMKASFALSDGGNLWLSPHIGELSQRKTIEFFEQTLARYLDWFKVEPRFIVCDMHPDYYSSRWAENYARDRGVELKRVQHHHAHAAAVMAEYGITKDILALVFDGTGYGPGGKIWGCELMLIEQMGASFKRLGHLRLLPLVGGEAAIRKPRRLAAGVLAELLSTGSARPNAAEPGAFTEGKKRGKRKFGEKLGTESEICDAGLQTKQGISKQSPNYQLSDTDLEGENLMKELRGRFGGGPGGGLEGWMEFFGSEGRQVAKQLAANLGVVRASSAGRLFDAVAGMIGLVEEISFEAQAPIALESLYDPSEESAYSFDISPDLILDYGTMFAELLDDLRKGTRQSIISSRFHNGLATAAIEWIKKASAMTGIKTVICSGGVFANRAFSNILQKKATIYGFDLVFPTAIPCSDGSIAAGQLQAIAALVELQANKS